MHSPNRYTRKSSSTSTDHSVLNKIRKLTLRKRSQASVIKPPDCQECSICVVVYFLPSGLEGINNAVLYPLSHPLSAVFQSTGFSLLESQALALWISPHCTATAPPRQTKHTHTTWHSTTDQHDRSNCVTWPKFPREVSSEHHVWKARQSQAETVSLCWTFWLQYRLRIKQ